MIGTGVRTVAFSDGKRVTYGSQAELLAAYQLICRSLDPSAGLKRRVAAHSKGIRPTSGPSGFTS